MRAHAGVDAPGVDQRAGVYPAPGRIVERARPQTAASGNVEGADLDGAGDDVEAAVGVGRGIFGGVVGSVGSVQGDVVRCEVDEAIARGLILVFDRLEDAPVGD